MSSLMKDVYHAETDIIYFKKRLKKCDEYDLVIYKVLNYFFENNSYSLYYNKKDITALLITYWFRLLSSFSKSELSYNRDTLYQTFVEGFNFYTKDFTAQEKVRVLFNFTWHLRVIQHIPSKRRLDINFIKRCANMSKLLSVDVSRGSWQGISYFDKNSIKIIQDDNYRLFFNQFEENLLKLIEAVIDLEEIAVNKDFSHQQPDDTSYNIVLSLIRDFIREENTLKINLYDYLVVSLYTLCCWYTDIYKVNLRYSLKKPLLQRVFGSKNNY